jgi:predicted lipid-binding transport protein (Tim44 family)
MKQMTNSPPLSGSALGGGVVAELVAGIITGLAFVRKLFFRTILVVAIAVAAVSFMIGMRFRDYLPGNPVPNVQGATSAPEHARDRPTKPHPSKRADDEELQRLIQKNPL